MTQLVFSHSTNEFLWARSCENLLQIVIALLTSRQHFVIPERCSFTLIFYECQLSKDTAVLHVSLLLSGPSENSANKKPYFEGTG